MTSNLSLTPEEINRQYMDDVQKAEADYKKELEANGVEFPVDDSVESPKEEEPEVETPEEPEKKPVDEPTDEPKERVARQLSDKYKEKKAELRTEREQREQAERERDEFKQRLDAITEANNSQEKSEATNDAVEYASQVGADPELVKLIIDNARQNQPQPDPELARRLNQFEQWQKQNAHLVEKQMFDDEFSRTVPSLKEMFPNADTEELGALKSELDKLSHSKEMHDKELEYVAFKNREHLSAFVSPKKRGMESKGRNQSEENSVEFNPNADLSKMSATQLESWENTYRKAGADEGGIVSSGKRKIIL